MSTTVTFHLRTGRTAPGIEELLREHLRARGADPERYWIQVHAADSEDQEGGRTDFGLEPTVVASIQPPGGEGDGALISAALATAHATASQMVALHDYTPLFAYRNGVLHLSPEDREFWKEHVLPGFTGRVEYGKVLPWMDT